MTSWKRRVGFAVLAVVPVVALGWLSWIRLERGHSYPEYSSLRSDPRGARLLVETLETQGIPVERNYHPLDLVPPKTDRTLMLIGVSRLAITDEENRITQALERWVDEGGRVVLALYPAFVGDPSTQSAFQQIRQANEDWRRQQLDEIAENWGVSVDFVPMEPVEAEALSDGALRLDWHSRLVFKDLGPGWEVIARRAGMPTVVERSRGDGSIVLVSDAYPLSNQGLLQSKPFALIQHLLGGRPVTVDESHHLIERRQAMVEVVGSQGLGGVFWVAAVLVLAYFWRSLSPLVPPPPRPASVYNEEEGFGQRDALLRLLERSLTRKALLAQCVEWWERSNALGAKEAKARSRRMNELVAATGENPKAEEVVAVYESIKHVAREGSHHD